MNEIEQEVLKEMSEAETVEEMLEAVGELKGEEETVESQVLVDAAGSVLANSLNSYWEKNR